MCNIINVILSSMSDIYLPVFFLVYFCHGIPQFGSWIFISFLPSFCSNDTSHMSLFMIMVQTDLESCTYEASSFLNQHVYEEIWKVSFLFWSFVPFQIC